MNEDLFKTYRLDKYHHGYFVFGLGFAAGSFYVLHFAGHLGSKRLLEHQSTSI